MPVATNIKSSSADDCTDSVLVTGKHFSKTRKRLKDNVAIDTDKQLKENKPKHMVSVNSKEPTGAKKKFKKSRTQEVIGQNTSTTNETVAESNVGKSKKRKHANSDVVAENSVQSDELKKGDHKIKKIKHQTVVSGKVSTNAGASSEKSKKISQTAESTVSSAIVTTDTGKKTKHAPIHKTKRQIVDSKTDKDEETDDGTVMTVPPDSTAKYHALEYLKRWKLQRSEWSFQKVRQVWLLQNMYDEKKV